MAAPIPTWNPPHQINVGEDLPTEVNAQGGQQSSIPYAFTLIDIPTLFLLAERLHYGTTKANGGRGYPKDNWRLIEPEGHANHLIVHLLSDMLGDQQDDHLGAIICRAMMYVATRLAQKR